MLIGAFACAHTPQLLIRPPTEDRELVLRVHAAFARVKERLTALRPDVIAIDLDHATIRDAHELIVRHGFTRVPAHRGAAARDGRAGSCVAADRVGR